MTTRQQELLQRAREKSEAAHEHMQALCVTFGDTPLNPDSVRIVLRQFSAVMATLTTLECSLRGNDPQIG